MGSCDWAGYAKLSQDVETLAVAGQGRWMGTWRSVKGELIHDLKKDVRGTEVIGILDAILDSLLQSTQILSSIRANELLFDALFVPEIHEPRKYASVKNHT